MDIGAVRAYLTGLQDRIVGEFERLDGKPFLRDEWQRPEGGGGVSRLVEEGNLLERGGVGFSHVLETEGDGPLSEGVLGFLEETSAPLDRLYFDWFGGLAGEPRALAGPSRAHYEGPHGVALRKSLERHVPVSAAMLEHPYFAREAPVTVIIDEIEALWSAIAERDDWSHFETKVKTIRDLGGALRGPAPTK